MKIFAAVIEWPDNHGRTPELILADSPTARAAEVREEVHAVAEALTDPEWREALEGHRHYPSELFTWAEIVFGEMDDRPAISMYEKEI